jgi:hypothetical protein
MKACEDKFPNFTFRFKRLGSHPDRLYSIIIRRDHYSGVLTIRKQDTIDSFIKKALPGILMIEKNVRGESSSIECVICFNQSEEIVVCSGCRQHVCRNCMLSIFDLKGFMICPYCRDEVHSFR